MLDVLSCAQLYPVGRGWREDPANKSLSLWTIIRIVLSMSIIHAQAQKEKMVFCWMDVAQVMKKMRLSSMVAVDGKTIENEVCCSTSSVMGYLSCC